jgi:hypothetical protein
MCGLQVRFHDSPEPRRRRYFVFPDSSGRYAYDVVNVGPVHSQEIPTMRWALAIERLRARVLHLHATGDASYRSDVTRTA